MAMMDIEDLVPDALAAARLMDPPTARRGRRATVRRRRGHAGSGAETAGAAVAGGEKDDGDHDGLPALPGGGDGDKALLPGRATLWLRTFGCAHNSSDSESMAGLLTDYGYVLTDNPDAADLWLLNSCTVKSPSEAAFMTLVRKADARGMPVVVSGCVPQGEPDKAELAPISMLGVSQIERVVEVVEQTLAGNVVQLLEKAPLPRLDLPKMRRNPLVEVIPLGTGCLGSCTYCKTRHARGVLGSYEVDAIVARARAVAAEGVTEIWLSSEDTGAYGRDIGTSMSALLQRLCDELPESVMLRVGMTNPPFILEQLDGIAAALNHPRVFSFIHIPVQSGSDAVLEGMRREYTAGEFARVVDFLRAAVPGVTIATDIICGFPGETDDDFDATLALVDRYRFPVVNISQFYPRPGTEAAKMKRLPNGVAKKRSRAMTKLFLSYTCFDDLVGSRQLVWVNTEVDSDGTHTVGHTKNYTKVLLPRDDTLRGRCVSVEVKAATKWHVEATVLAEGQLTAAETAAAEAEGAAAPAAKDGAAAATDGKSASRSSSLLPMVLAIAAAMALFVLWRRVV